AVGSATATAVLLAAGLDGTVYLVIPALLMATLLLFRMRVVLDGRQGQKKRPPQTDAKDDWPAFYRLVAVVISRSIVFFGTVSFVALYFIHSLGTSEAIGGAALTTF